MDGIPVAAAAAPAPAAATWRPAAVAVTVAGSGLVLALPSGSLVRVVAEQVVWALLALMGSASALLRARREPAARAGWTLLGVAMFVIVIGGVLTGSEHARAGTVLPYPRLGDWIQLPAIAATGFAMLLWPVSTQGPPARLRAFVDALLFAIAAFATAWGLVLWPVRAVGLRVAEWAVLVSQFGITAVIFAIVAYLVLGEPERLRGPVGWVGGALAAGLLSTLGILAVGARGAYYAGHAVDVVANIALLIFILATLSQYPVSGRGRAGTAVRDPMLFGGWLTYGSVSVAFTIAVWRMIVEGREDTVLVLHGFAIILLLMVRQILAVRDVRNLTLGLEATVAERTRALEESQAALQRTARLEALGRLSGGIAHDINNLLMGILGYSELIISSTPQGDDRRHDAQEISKAVERGSRLTRQLLAFARKQPGRALVLDPRALVHDIEGLLRQLLGRNIAVVVRHTKGSGRVNIDPGQLEQVLVNMAVNARDAMPRGGTLTIEVGEVELDADEARRFPASSPGPYVTIGIVDTGTGMTREVLNRIFEPFFTTKAEAGGSGLGLATCYGIVNQAGGFVTVDSVPGAGTRFDVCLPLTHAPAQWEPTPAGTESQVGGTETILLAEDEASVRAVITATLKAQGYTVLVADDGLEAVAIAEKHEGPLDLFLTDMIMPGLSGMDAALRIAEFRPGVPVLVVSGFVPESVVPAEVAGRPVTYLAKPIAPLELMRQVRRSLDAAAGHPRVTPVPAPPAMP